MKKELVLVLILSVAALLVLSSTLGCAASAVPTQSGPPETASPQGDEEPTPTPTDLLEGVIITRTPIPTT